LATTQTYDPSWVMADSDVMNCNEMNCLVLAFQSDFVDLHRDAEFADRREVFVELNATQVMGKAFESHHHKREF